MHKDRLKSLVGYTGVFFAVLGSCREGWMEFQASCYLEERGTGGDWGRDWKEAQDHCAAKGAHVVSINSMKELFFTITVRYARAYI